MKNTVSQEQINEVLDHYIMAALWSSSDTSEKGEFLDQNYGEGDITAEAKERMRADVKRFLDENQVLLKEAGLSNEQIGHDFWLTRNGHGAGFWDRGLGEVGDQLADAARKFKESDLYVGDDEKIHIMASGGEVTKGYASGGEVVYKKKINLGKVDYDGRGRKINAVDIAVEIKNKPSAINYETLEEVTNVPELTMSGNIWNGRHTDIVAGGQMLDTIQKLFPGNQKLKRLVEIWEEYHLNDLKAGTKAQTEAIKAWRKHTDTKGWAYEEEVKHLEWAGLLNDRGYKYGSAWLYMPIPESVIEEVKTLSEELDRQKNEGGVLSNDEIIKDLEFEDQTDRKHGRYSFSFVTVDKDGAEILDYDGTITEAPASSRMNDEIEWGQNTPEDHQEAEKYITDQFYEWKNKKSGKKKSEGGSVFSETELEKMLTEEYGVYPKYAISYIENAAYIKRDNPSFNTRQIMNELEKRFPQLKELKEYKARKENGGKAFVPKSSQVNKLQSQIDSLQNSMSSPILPMDMKEKMQESIERLKAQKEELSKRISMKEKLSLENGRYYIQIDQADKQDLYTKLRDKGIKVKWSALEGKVRAIANSPQKLRKVYDVYASLLRNQNREVPPIEQITSKITV